MLSDHVVEHTGFDTQDLYNAARWERPFMAYHAGDALHVLSVLCAFSKNKSRSFLTGRPCILLTRRGSGRAFRLSQGHGLAGFAEFFSPVFPAFLPHDVGDRSVSGGIRVIVSHGKYLLSFLWRSFLCQKKSQKAKRKKPLRFLSFLYGGAYRIRTGDLYNANVARYQLC